MITWLAKSWDDSRIIPLEEYDRVVITKGNTRWYVQLNEGELSVHSDDTLTIKPQASNWIRVIL